MSLETNFLSLVKISMSLVNFKLQWLMWLTQLSHLSGELQDIVRDANNGR